MTARSPTFLSRLAPLAANSPSAVRAALPARYAPSPRGVRIDEQVESDVRLEPAQLRPDAPIPARAAHVERPVPTVTKSDADIGLAPVPDPLPSAPGRPDVAKPAVSSKLPETEMFRGASSDPSRMPIAKLPKVGGPKALADRPRRGPLALGVPALEPHAKPDPELSGPLTRGTVIERGLAARPGEPDVVQVTIDRIDIRMPPEVGQAPGHIEPRRRSTPTISLSDYLRGVDSTRRSGG